MSVRPVNPSFEIGGSVFNSLNALRSLIAATSEDDVHTQAVLAVEQLGACVPVSPERIDEAVNALGGQTSIPVQNLKASIGITSGGLCMVMRQSTPLLQFFVLCAACKVTLLDEECGNLMFEMLKTSKVLAKLPCSAVQITRMISQVSGQAGLVAPVDMMHEVASAVDERGPTPDIFRRMEVNVLAEMLIALFEQIRDETVDGITLVGHQNCVWLASSLLWLFGDRSCLTIDDTVIKGDVGAKLCIHIEPVKDIPWNMQVFRKSEDPTEFVFEISSDESDSLGQIPIRSLKSFLGQYYWSAFESATMRREAAIASGKVAQTLILAISQRGLLYLECADCRAPTYCNKASLADVAHTLWLAKVERIVIDYGWSAEDGASFDPGLLAAILKVVDDWRRGIPLSMVNVEDVVSPIKHLCRNFILSCISEAGVETDYVLDPALYVAADAAVTCTTFFERGSRFIKPLDHEILEFADFTVANVLSGGLEVSDFRKHAFRQLLPGLDTWHDCDLVVARDGYVAGMDILWTESAGHPDALKIRMQLGQIKKDQVLYSSIREAPFVSRALNLSTVPAFDAVKGFVMPEVGWQHPIKDRLYSFDTFASTNGTRLELKHYMRYTDSLTKSAQRRKASWVSAIDVLATATHLDLESQMTASLSNTLNMRLTRQLLGNVYWADPFSEPNLDRGMRILIRAGPVYNKVKIFGAGICNEAQHKVCCQIFIRHRSPLLQCIERAESARLRDDCSWVIVD
ncbi:hypothetical protein PV08_02910 [Exophiala spinifera]|uniref:Uncharacterized protein n=1 Tax=Exophiala spinifera TaxID=91928 RepID=A0A0D1YTQ2_9EURO|nr:uncharacterized protein PV08_02910 [Exophiala spinifera]KIW18621.1 hypothetical protein PV08_02910 [Exophiala spinifera]